MSQLTGTDQFASSHWEGDFDLEVPALCVCVFAFYTNNEKIQVFVDFCMCDSLFK